MFSSIENISLVSFIILAHENILALSVLNPTLCIIVHAWLDDGGSVKVYIHIE